MNRVSLFNKMGIPKCLCRLEFQLFEQLSHGQFVVGGHGFQDAAKKGSGFERAMVGNGGGWTFLSARPMEGGRLGASRGSFAFHWRHDRNVVAPYFGDRLSPDCGHLPGSFVVLGDDFPEVYRTEAHTDAHRLALAGE